MRIMPKKGFYVHNTLDNYALYCTGDKSANMYFESENHGPQWNYVLWTCVPGKKEMLDYTHYETLPDGFPPLSVNSLEKMGIKKFSY
tara:strand:- start:282 stop:542 length:261 start_codon:yes stop_codon:yes gene_type:complete